MKKLDVIELTMRDIMFMEYFDKDWDLVEIEPNKLYTTTLNDILYKIVEGE